MSGIAYVQNCVGAGGRHCRGEPAAPGIDSDRACGPTASGGEMVLIPAGTFTMGDGAGRPDETPHTVSVSAFYLDKYPVTQELYEKVMGVNPSKQQGKKQPGREDAVDRCRPFLQQVFGAGRADALLQSGHLGVQLRRQRLPSSHRGGMGICLSRRQHREVLFR